MEPMGRKQLLMALTDTLLMQRSCDASYTIRKIHLENHGFHKDSNKLFLDEIFDVENSDKKLCGLVKKSLTKRRV